MQFKRTKIVATLSPSTCTPTILRSMLRAGLDVVRINTAHCSTAEAAEMLTVIRTVSDRLAILIDTKGPNIRTTEIENELKLATGDTVIIGRDFNVSYSRFADELGRASRIVIDDGEMELEIRAVDNNLVECRALNDGVIRNRKSINVPGAVMSTPALTAKDIEFLRFAAEQKVDYIAHSFVRRREDVLAVRRELERCHALIPIIAKIENREGVENIESILEAADGLMVARGDLGIEIPLEEVPVIQKRLIRRAIMHSKPVITATQMLQSMITSPRPTRAEVSDVANAVFDGTDAVMLSGETAQGAYPVQAVKMMASIIRESEAHGQNDFASFAPPEPLGAEVTAFLVKSAGLAAEDLPVKAIVVNTASGRTARMFAARRWRTPIIGLSYTPAVVRQMALWYGITPLPSEYLESSDELLQDAVARVVKAELVDHDDLLVLIGRQHGADFCTIVRPADLK